VAAKPSAFAIAGDKLKAKGTEQGETMAQPIDLSTTPEFAVDQARAAPPGDPFDFVFEADRLVLAAKLLAEVDAAELLRHISRAHTLGPILDPTRYQAALHRGSLDQIAALARAALTIQTTLESIRAEVEL
jgi:hypothetical protein